MVLSVGLQDNKSNSMRHCRSRL